MDSFKDHHTCIIGFFMDYLFIYLFAATLDYWSGVIFLNLKTQGLIPEHVCDAKVPTPLNHKCGVGFFFYLVI